MRIVVIGPGKDPKRFGTYFVNRATEENHSVTTFSYRLQKETPEEITDRFEKTISNLDKIDLLLYNCIGGFYPGEENHYHSNHSVIFNEWQRGILINAAMPHMFATKCLEKMNSLSSIVFMTSSASYLINRNNFLHMAGYFGTKSAMNHLAMALSEFNDKGAKVCIMGPHIPYDEDEEVALTIMEKLTERILNITDEDNGKILQCYPPDGRIWYHEGGTHA